MKQQRLYHYFGPLRPQKPTTRPKSRLSLLDLPASVRTLIYRHTGIPPRKEFDGQCWTMNHGYAVTQCKYLDPARACSQCAHGSADIYNEPCNQCRGCCSRCQLFDVHEDDRRNDFPYQLFSVCRLMYEEATRLLYTESYLEVTYTAPGGLDPLLRLGPLAVASLRNLNIHLNDYLCEGGPACTRPQHCQQDCYSTCRVSGHDEPLGIRPGSRNDRYACQNLRQACAHLARFVPAGQLKLAFICEVRDHRLATKLMEALLLLPPLRACTIALSLTLDPQLRALAIETQARLTNPSRLSRGLLQHFPLRRLPREIQLEILRKSDLVAPFHLRFRAEANQPSRSVRCTYKRQHDPLGFMSSFLYKPNLCCCSYKAHSSSAWICNHWHFPDALFLVDRQMEADARAIMYSENIWVWDGIDSLISAWVSESSELSSEPSSEPWVIPLSRIHANLSSFFSNARRVQVQPPRLLLPECEEARKTCVDNLSTLLAECVPKQLNLTLVLSHPVHQDRDVTALHRLKCVGDQEYIVECLMAGLRGKPLQDLVVSFERVYFEPNSGFYYYCVSCHVGNLLGELEFFLEHRLRILHALAVPSSLIRVLHCSRDPVKIHSPSGSGNCELCGTASTDEPFFHS